MRLQRVLQYIKDTPSVLERTIPHLKQILGSKSGKIGQGLANSIPGHEACFADVLNQHGFLFISKDKGPIHGHPCYHHQLGGTQTKTDFHVYETINDKIISFQIELKHSNGKTFCLNDGWFEPETIYIINWSLHKKHKVLIALGNDIPTNEEKEAMKELISIKKRLNSEKKTIGSLIRYVRFANKYKCDKFTPEFDKNAFAKLLTRLALPERHSQSVEQQTDKNRET